ncbi:MAG: carboxypeptidase regulatory-like domain-containing protein [Nitrospirae bacterium]|nr:carboxypeptidase regulatory-like domain-containing protein [Nitrospirota bacterium]
MMKGIGGWLLAITLLALPGVIGCGEDDEETTEVVKPATKIEFFVKDAAGNAIEGATVSVEGQAATATTDATGAFKLEGLSGDMVFLRAKGPGSSYLEGGTRHEAVEVENGALAESVTINLSSRPSDSAKYVGGTQCGACHTTQAADEGGSAHAHSITPDKTRMISKDLWPAVGATKDTKFTALDPTDATGKISVAVVLCQPSAGDYQMKFGGTADCSVTTDGTFVPVSGTYGGEGDGGIANTPNLGKFKQRYLAKLSDVPLAASWTYTAGKDKDYLILPIQITQSGDGSPKLGKYHETDWTGRGRTFSRKCSGCHNTGLEISWEKASGKSYIESYNYLDLNITCEICHGPGSEHIAAPTEKRKLTIITPRNLTAEATSQICGACHSGDDGSSKDPDGAFGFAYNAGNASKVGGGHFVPGVYDLKDYIKGFMVLEKDGGAFNAWPDGKHGLAHRQQYPELAASKHWSNSEEKLSCVSCHNPHTLYQGPKKFEEEMGKDEYVLETPTFKNNVLCLGCHAGDGPYTSLTKDSVAAAHVAAGGKATKNGAAVAGDAAAATAVADAVKNHMKDKVPGMGATYDPTNDAKPVGRCQSCHMPKTGKSGGYTTGKDAAGNSALVSGDQGSHVFDVIKFETSSALKKASGGADTDIMPNSCGGCHANFLISGD